MLSLSGVAQTGAETFSRQVSEVTQYFLVRHSSGDVGPDIADRDVHPPDTGLYSPLAGFEGDDVAEVYVKSVPSSQPKFELQQSGQSHLTFAPSART